MAFTNLGKQKVMEEGLKGAARFISLHLTNNTELSGHGYARKEVAANQMMVSNTGVVTFPANLAIYTATDSSAQRAQKVGLYNSSSGGDALMDPEVLTGTIPPAPERDQEFRLSLTINP